MGLLLCWGSSPIVTQGLRETTSSLVGKGSPSPWKGQMDEGRKGEMAVSSAGLWLGEQLHSCYLTLQPGLLF